MMLLLERTADNGSHSPPSGAIPKHLINQASLTKSRHTPVTTSLRHTPVTTLVTTRARDDF
jgi:hypothetical protein